jgi:hypothetical protein
MFVYCIYIVGAFIKYLEKFEALQNSDLLKKPQIIFKDFAESWKLTIVIFSKSFSALNLQFKKEYRV